MEFCFGIFWFTLGLEGGHFWRAFILVGFSWACEQIDFFFSGR